MELSVLVAKIIAVIYLSASIGGFLDRDYFRRIADGMYKNAALAYMMGFVAVIFGFLILHFHNFRASDWTVLITIIGCLSLVKGVFIIVSPKYFQRLYEPFLTDRVLKNIPYVLLLLGVLFGYFGFVHGRG